MDRLRRIPRGCALVETQGSLETGQTTRISPGRECNAIIIDVSTYLCYFLSCGVLVLLFISPEADLLLHNL